MDDRGPWVLYYALAVAAAIVLALPSRDLLAWAVIVGSGVGAGIIRSQWLRVRPWSRADLSWVALFVAVFVPVALILRTWPLV